MGKFSEISDEFKSMFEEEVESTTIPNWVRFTLAANNKMKDLYQLRKFDELIEMLTQYDIAVVVNEDILFQLEEEQQRIVIKEILHGIVIDTQTDKITIEKPNFTTYSGLLAKIGSEKMISLKESVESLFRAKTEQEDQEKKSKKAKK